MSLVLELNISLKKILYDIDQKSIVVLLINLKPIYINLKTY